MTKIGSLVIDLTGHVLMPEEKELLGHPLVGGVILFARNYASRDQLTALCQAIQAARKVPLLIMADQEGGRVQRFISEFTRLPPLAMLGQLFDNDPLKACALATDVAWLMAIELLSVGVDLSLAPVLDLQKEVSKVIGNRAFHKDPAVVIQLATAYITGLHQAGMASTGKHFPGHGAVSVDSHIELPIDQRPFVEIERDDLLPFAALVKNGIRAFMAAHIVFPTVDANPVGFSRYWLQTVLRSRLRFTGAILSDDLTMEGANISSSYTDRVVSAREAGCDFALLCNHRAGVIEVLDKLPYHAHLLDEPVWRPLQSQYSDTTMSFTNHHRWQKTHHWLQQLN